jgi:hypothetical protein
MSTGAGAFVMAYFSGQDETDGEQIRLAVSHGVAPTRWHTRRDGRAHLVSDVGERGRAIRSSSSTIGALSSS